MSRRRCLAVAVLVCWVAFGPMPAADPQTMTGSYVAGDGEYPDSGQLVAVFTPADDGTWGVVFDFDFQGEDYTFSGTAEGSLSDGFLSGTVTNMSGKRKFVFRGKTEKAVFRGTHAEIEYGGETPTGTMVLERKSP